MEAVTGIREQELKDLAIEIMNYADDISDILNKYDNKFYELDNYYEGKSYDELKSYYGAVRDQYRIVKANIISYSDDFIALIEKMHEGATTLTKLFNQFEQDTKDKTKNILS